MNEYHEQSVSGDAVQPEVVREDGMAVPQEATFHANGVTAPEIAPVEQPMQEPSAEEPNRHVEAGRKGAQRVHELIERGRLYEQEHGLTRGRQRLRQLLEEGKLYEHEHGLSTRSRKSRGKRMSSEQALRRFLDSLLRIVKPSYRPHLLRLIEALQVELG